MEEGVKFLEGGGVHSWTPAEETTDYAGEVHVPSLGSRPFPRGGRFWERAYIRIVPR